MGVKFEGLLKDDNAMGRHNAVNSIINVYTVKLMDVLQCTINVHYNIRFSYNG